MGELLRTLHTISLLSTVAYPDIILKTSNDWDTVELNQAESQLIKKKFYFKQVVVTTGAIFYIRKSVMNCMGPEKILF